MARRKKQKPSDSATADQPEFAGVGDAPEETTATDLQPFGEAIPNEVTDEATHPSVPQSEPTEVAEMGEVAEAIGEQAGLDAEGAQSQEGVEAAQDEALLSVERLEAIIESLLFASDKPLGTAELKRMLGERDTKRIDAAVESLVARKAATGIQVATVAGGWQLRTNPENAPWVGKLLAGRPVRLSRAMMETMAIIAYRQPITRPEIDDVRGVDCGPVLKTLLDRGLIRVIGKKEDVGRPMLYGTTAEFLKTFSLNDLTDLPTLRQFHELAAEEMAKVDAEAGPASQNAPAGGAEGLGGSGVGAGASAGLHPALVGDPDEEDDLLKELDQASKVAARAGGTAETEPTNAG